MHNKLSFFIIFCSSIQLIDYLLINFNFSINCSSIPTWAAILYRAAVRSNGPTKWSWSAHSLCFFSRKNSLRLDSQSRGHFSCVRQTWIRPSTNGWRLFSLCPITKSSRQQRNLPVPGACHGNSSCPLFECGPYHCSWTTRTAEDR